MKQRFQEFWEGLNTRERRVLLLGVVGVVFYMNYLIQAGLNQTILKQTKALSEKKATFAWMQSVRHQVRVTTSSHEKMSEDKAHNVVSRALKQASFHQLPYTLKDLSHGELKVSMVSVPYHDFLNWLWRLTKRYSFEIKQFEAKKTSQKGYVKVSLVIVF